MDCNANTNHQLTRGGVDDQHGAVGLAGARDHVLDEVAVAGGVDDGAVVLGRLELPQRNVNGDAALALRLQLVQHLRSCMGRADEVTRLTDETSAHCVCEIRCNTELAE